MVVMSDVATIIRESREETIEEREYQVQDAVDSIEYDLIQLEDDIATLLDNYGDYVDDMNEEEEDNFCADIHEKVAFLEEVKELLRRRPIRQLQNNRGGGKTHLPPPRKVKVKDMKKFTVRIYTRGLEIYEYSDIYASNYVNAKREASTKYLESHSWKSIFKVTIVCPTGAIVTYDYPF